jgi:hypothetical protein
VLTINESREQTQAIHRRQRAARTLTGLLASKQGDAVRSVHRAAQTLLRSLPVVNPFAEQLTFRTESTRLRRDHAKYLTLIDAIALLHQHQRPVHTIEHGGQRIDYIEATLEDIALANRLAHEVLGRSLDELPPQTRRTLSVLDGLVRERMRTQALARADVRLTRREVRAATGMADTQVRVHLDRLVDLDYLLLHAGRNGQRFVYELAFDGDVTTDAAQAIGLVDIAALAPPTKTPRGSEGHLAGHLRAARGDLAAASRPLEIPLCASPGAALPLVAASAPETAPLEPRSTRPAHRNGSAALAG